MAAQERYKIWKASDDSDAGMMVTNEGAFVVGNERNFMVAGKLGVNITGKSISFGTVSENMRVGGLFINMNDFVKMVPQTLTTPVPSQIPFPPIEFAMNVVADLPTFIAMTATGAF